MSEIEPGSNYQVTKLKAPFIVIEESTGIGPTFWSKTAGKLSTQWRWDETSEHTHIRLTGSLCYRPSYNKRETGTGTAENAFQRMTRLSREHPSQPREEGNAAGEFPDS